MRGGVERIISLTAFVEMCLMGTRLDLINDARNGAELCQVMACSRLLEI